MIVLDTSALIAVLNKEPGHLLYATALDEADRCIISALTLHEASVVMLGKRGLGGIEDLRSLLASLAAEVVSLAAAQRTLASAA